MQQLLLRISVLTMLFFAQFNLFGQEFTGREAASKVAGARKVWVKEGAVLPSYVEFQEGNEIPLGGMLPWMSKQFGLAEDAGFETISEEVDQFGVLHRRVMVTWQGHTLFDAMLVFHIRQGKVYAFNGELPDGIVTANSVIISESAALQLALQHIGATRYKWQMPEEEALLKTLTDDPSASYYPMGEVKLYRKKGQEEYRYTWMFNVYADQPLYRAEVFVDAATGAILFEHNQIHESDDTGTVVTKYSGTRTLTSDSTGVTYRLRETGRGNGVETFNCLKGTNYGSAADFTDSDNYWNNFNTNLDEVAGDAHWGSESTYDYYFQKFNRNSINNQGFKLISYVHYDNNYANAFWDGQRMTYGDGNGGSMGPLTALDITAHEITHGMTSFTADLVYQDESGALNEAYSDIFGCAVEWFAKPTMANWLMGENIGSTIRSISNPKSKGLPNTYLGTYWYTGTGDNGGVHTNCGPMSFWFYLLSAGGSGTNDLSNSYSVTGISIDSAAAIAYRTLTVYLTNSSEYADARYYSIQSAIDLFGACSQQVASTTNALYAIGVGGQYIPGVISDFSSPMTQFCAAPASVTFNNLSNNGLTYFWDFGDGLTSTAVSPTHTYTSMGNYDVTLIVSGGSCGADTLEKLNYISIDSQNPCVANIPQSGTTTNTNCTGFLMDSGGSQDYQDNTDGIFIISPSGAMSITLTFQTFDFEAGFDYLYIYDGTGTSAPLIGQYDGTALPGGGTITSTTGSITLRQYTDQGLTRPGFLLGWNCNYPTAAPIANFIVSDTVTCNGQVTFMDVSTNGPNSWLWDFGDGGTGNTKIVSHTYLQSGLYTVTLVSANTFGGDTIIKQSLVRVELPFPDVASAMLCDSGSVILSNPDTINQTNWYTSATSTTPVFTGASYITPLVNQTTTFWAEELIQKPEFSGGKPSNAGGGTYFTNTAKHYLVFDATAPVLLKSVVMYAGAAGNRTIELQSSTGSVIQSVTVNVPQGMSTVILNLDVPAGTDLRLVGPASPNLYRNDGGIVYPYQIGGLVTINHSSATTNPTGYYYYFYQWKISEYPCVSPKVPVDVIVSNNPPLAGFTHQVQFADVTFTDVSVNPGINTWDFGDGSAGSGTNPVHHYNAIGTYEVTLLVDNGCGVDSMKEIITVLSMDIPEIQSSAALKLYPNPSTGTVTVDLPADVAGKPVEVFLMDMLGKRVRTEILELNETSFSLKAHHPQSGVYILRLVSEGKTYFARLTLI